MILRKFVVKPEEVPASEHFKIWRDSIGELADARPLGQSEWRFLGDFEAYRMVDVSITMGHVMPFEYHRAALNPGAPPAVVLTMAMEGEYMIQYNQSHSVRVDSSQMVIGSFNAESRVIAEKPVSYFSIYLFSPALLAASALNDSTPGIEIPMSGGIRAAIFSLVAQLQNSLRTDDHIAASALLKAIEVMVDQLARPAYFASGQVDDNRMMAIQAFVDENNRDPALGVDLLCERFHMSRATLYRQMQHVGGVKRYLMSRRLVRCFDELRKGPSRSDGFQRALVKAYHFKSFQDFAERYKNHFNVDPVTMLNAGEAESELMSVGGDNADIVNWSAQLAAQR